MAWRNLVSLFDWWQTSLRPLNWFRLFQNGVWVERHLSLLKCLDNNLFHVTMTTGWRWNTKWWENNLWHYCRNRVGRLRQNMATRVHEIYLYSNRNLSHCHWINLLGVKQCTAKGYTISNSKRVENVKQKWLPFNHTPNTHAQIYWIIKANEPSFNLQTVPTY